MARSKIKTRPGRPRTYNSDTRSLNVRISTSLSDQLSKHASELSLAHNKKITISDIVRKAIENELNGT